MPNNSATKEEPVLLFRLVMSKLKCVITPVSELQPHRLMENTAKPSDTSASSYKQFRNKNKLIAVFQLSQALGLQLTFNMYSGNF